MDDQVKVFRATTQTLRGSAEFDAFCEDFGRNVLQLEMSPLGTASMYLDAVIRSTADIGLAIGRMSPMRNHHPETLGDDSFVFSVMREGQGKLSHGRHTIDIGSGGALLMHNGDRITFESPTATRQTTFKLRRDLLALRLPSPEDAIGRSMPENEPALRLLAGYVDVLADAEVRLDPDAARLASSNIYDLIALSLSRTADPRPFARGIGAARSRALRVDIQASLGDPALSIGEVARRHGISASYARRLFAAEGTSFAHYVLEQRLMRAHRLLTDPRQRQQSISSIAYEVGFGDLSYFNRSFRQRYGATPSDIRA
jgi:AraC-like DNA-binding protein